MTHDWLDRRAARANFERAAAADDVLAREVERRVMERLEYIKLAPTRVLDVACGAAASRAALRARYPDATLVGVDWSLPALQHARPQPSLLRRAKALFNTGPADHLVAADAATLPFPNESFDLVWSNLSLAWAPDPQIWLQEWHRVLRVGGLLMFTTYGPDTLKRLRAAFAAVDPTPYVHPFIDMHDLGDALVRSSFADPVMDMEMLTLTYGSAAALIAELRAVGARNVHRLRRRSLTGRRRWMQMLQRYEALAVDGRIPADVEIVYGHAWKAAPRALADGRQIIHFDPASRAGVRSR